MTRALDQAEANARAAVDEWIVAAKASAACPGASAIALFDTDQRMLARIAEAFEVEMPALAGVWSASGLAWTRGAMDASFACGSWMMPWASVDMRELMLQRVTERFGEAAIIACRARCRLS